MALSADEQKAEPDQSADSGQSADEKQSGTESEEGNNSILELSTVADGTYQGEGFRGTTSVSVTVENGKIIDITAIFHKEDEEFFECAEDMVISEIISSQSLDVSCVSGATFSSNGILESVADALNVNFDNPNQYNSKKDGQREKNRRRHFFIKFVFCLNSNNFFEIIIVKCQCKAKYMEHQEFMYGKILN